MASMVLKLARFATIAFAMILAFGLVGCSGPKDTVIPTDISRWDTDLPPSLDRLSTSDRQLAVAYLDRTKSAARLGGQEVPTGVTIGQAIEKQRTFDQSQSQQRLASRNQQDQADQRRKESEERAASVFSVALAAKELIPADLSSTRSDQVAFTFEFRNVGSKELTGVKGTLLVSDNWFGTELKTIPLDYRQPLAVGAGETFQAKLSLSPSAIIDQRVRNTELSQMKVTFTPELVQFADGTRLDFSTALAQP